MTDVEKAQATIDYSTVDAGVELADESFAWAPPEDAKDASKMEQGGGQQEYPAMKLEGAAAPAFKLNDLDGNEVTLESLKGQVVLIDFWASWCGPCRQSMPETVALSKELAPKGLKAFAINVGEDQPTAKAAADELKIEIPVLLDTQQEASQAYAANAIPMAVVIGKDGNVRKVFIGMTDPQIMRTAIEAALAE
jgi:thiol-disulfide isomerase/thioredoxin